MAQLEPAAFADLVTRLYREPVVQNSVFGLPRAKWYQPAADDPDLAVNTLGGTAGNPAGPAAGPHTQLAQNMLLAYVAGGRILELKTVQAERVARSLRPYINIGAVGLCANWGAGLYIRDALHQYVAGAMLIELFRRDPDIAGAFTDNLSGAVICDVGVGYSLSGIRRDRVRGFLDSMRSASAIVEHLRAQIPREFTFARMHTYPIRIANHVTVSTHPDCSADEIEQIAELLIGQHDLDVYLKLNPAALGVERLEQILRDTLGYDQFGLPSAAAAGMNLAEAIDVCRRLSTYARQCGRGLGLKFVNALPIHDRARRAAPDEEPHYLSGKPLHVVGLTLANELRKRLEPATPVGFSAGIDRHNFAPTVACGFAPVAACTDLLRPGGYGRIRSYLGALVQEMRRCGAARIDEFVLNGFGRAGQAAQRAAGTQAPDQTAEMRRQAVVCWAGLLNTSRVASMARANKRYRAEKNHPINNAESAPPLRTFDCPTCETCESVCPHAALFTYPTAPVTYGFHDVIVTPGAKWHEGPMQEFALHSERQVAVFADNCDQCGNCATACDQSGNPEDVKPNIHIHVESFAASSPHDAVVLDEKPQGGWIRARIGGREYQLTHERQANVFHFDDGTVTLRLSAWNHQVIDIRPRGTLFTDHVVNMRIYHMLRSLREGIVDPRFVNPANIRWHRRRLASGT